MRTIFPVGLLLLVIPAAGAVEFTDEADVIVATPLYDTVNEPQQECWNEPLLAQPAPEPGRDYTGALLGGVTGGLLGSQIGQGNGRIAGAALGALAGALGGDRIANRRYDVPAPGSVQTTAHCRTFDNYHSVVKGYTVLYRYQGREAEVVLPYKPGPKLKIGIGVVDPATKPTSRY